MSPPKSNDGGGHQDGDGLAARWMARHWAAMVEAARRYAGGCPMTAEDIAQEALWAAFERRDRLVDPAGERAWLLAFVRNKGREAVRQRRRGGDRLPDEYLDAAVAPSTLDIPDLRRDRVLEVLPRLPDTERIIVRRILDGWVSEAIASELRLKKGTYYVYKHRAKKTLMKLLGMDAPRRPRSPFRRNQP